LKMKLTQASQALCIPRES
jgi:hypothetical protein